MNFFDVIPSELFSPLASPNRVLYADALDVLYSAYRENLKISEDILYSMLRSKLEQQLADATFEDEDIDVEELRDVSGRARFLIRKLCSKGWFEKERGDDFEEYITVPSYSSRILELFHQLRDDSPIRGYSYVFGTYSTLKVAYESDNVYDKMAAIYGAYDNTQSLINLLQMVYHNVKHYLGEKEQLAFLGIYARPEYYELAGNCLIRTQRGALDVNASGRCGLALPSTLIDAITEIEMRSIECVTFIENKTNYDEYIASEKQSGELVIYHGGFLSPQKRQLFALIANGADATSNIRFWADIDKGGFQMFEQLQELIPTLAPMRMAGEFVEKYHEYGLVRSEEYLSALKADLESGKHLLFKDAIEKVLRFGVTIEQEAFLNS